MLHVSDWYKLPYGMSTLLIFVWLACTVWFIVSTVKFRRKTGNRKFILYSFLGGLISFVLFNLAQPASTPPAQASTNSPASSTGTEATASDAENKQFKQVAAALAQSCGYDIVREYPRYAKSEADVKVVVPGTIYGDQARAQVQAGGVKFNCLAVKGAQDTAKPVASDAAVAKRIAAEDAAAAKKQQEVEAAAAAQQQKAADAAAEQAARQEACSGVKLVVESWSWSDEDSFVKATGEVTNVSGESLKSIEAEVSYYTSDGTFVKNDTGFLEYNPVLPGQTTPFSTITTGNPAMSNAKLRFKEFVGGEIVAMNRKEYKRSCV